MLRFLSGGESHPAVLFQLLQYLQTVVLQGGADLGGASLSMPTKVPPDSLFAISEDCPPPPQVPSM